MAQRAQRQTYQLARLVPTSHGHWPQSLLVDHPQHQPSMEITTSTTTSFRNAASSQRQHCAVLYFFSNKLNSNSSFEEDAAPVEICNIIFLRASTCMSLHVSLRESCSIFFVEYVCTECPLLDKGILAHMLLDRMRTENQMA